MLAAPACLGTCACTPQPAVQGGTSWGSAGENKERRNLVSLLPCVHPCFWSPITLSQDQWKLVPGSINFVNFIGNRAETFLQLQGRSWAGGGSGTLFPPAPLLANVIHMVSFFSQDLWFLYERIHSRRRNSHKNVTFATFLVPFQPLKALKFQNFPGVTCLRTRLAYECLHVSPLI